MIIPDHLVSPINSLQQNMFINAPTISQTAALKCWDDDTIEELEKHIEKYRESRSIILKELKKIKELDQKNIAPADGGFYVYVDLGDENLAKGKGAVEMCEALLEEEFVAFTPGTDFEDPSGRLGDRRFRISYAGGVQTASEGLKVRGFISNIRFRFVHCGCVLLTVTHNLPVSDFGGFGRRGQNVYTMQSKVTTTVLVADKRRDFTSFPKHDRNTCIRRHLSCFSKYTWQKIDLPKKRMIKFVVIYSNEQLFEFPYAQNVTEQSFDGVRYNITVLCIISEVL